MIKSPGIAWRDDKTPEAIGFDDIYFSPEDGVAETSHVFLKGIGAPEVWQGRENFLIGETGFGTGLSFLCAWDLFEKTADTNSKLHFVSVEGFPLERQDLERALRAFPEFEEKAADLVALYPPKQAGFHRLVFAAGRVTLTLLVGPVEEVLGKAAFEADAWFLDGFAPSRNPEMWTPDVMGHVARLSRPGARVASFTVAGAVRRGLEAAGYAVEKKPGFGRKRDCLAGALTKKISLPAKAPWFDVKVRRPEPQRIAIIGAGIAGSCAAAAFGREGKEVHVFDRWDIHAQEGSGNPAAMMNPRMSLGKDADAIFRAQAYVHAMSLYDRMESDGRKVWKARSGALQLANEDRDEAYMERLAQEGGLPEGWLEAIDADEASARCGVALPRGGLYLTNGGFLDPDLLCAELLGNVSFHGGIDVDGIEHRQSGWRLYADGKEVFEADAVVFANALGAAEFAQTRHIPFVPNRGQLTLVPANEETENLKTAVAYDGYISPAFEVEEGLTCHLVGATYDRPDRFDMERASDIRSEDHERNMLALKNSLGANFAVSDPSNFRGRAAVRCTTPDRLPLVGPAPVAETYERLYYDVHHGRDKVYAPGDHHDGLYVLAGFGSKGFQYAPLAAEVLVADVLGLPSPVPEVVRQALHPARFVMRALKRKTWASPSGKKGRS